MYDLIYQFHQSTQGQRKGWREGQALLEQDIRLVNDALLLSLVVLALSVVVLAQDTSRICLLVYQPIH